MGTESAKCDALGRIFIAALLLAGSIERAEAAALDAIRCSDPDDMSEDSLIRGVAIASVIPIKIDRAQRAEELRMAAEILPNELQNVLYLTQAHRQCYVLRVLLSLPRTFCARLLRLDIYEVDERATGAMWELAGLKRCEETKARASSECEAAAYLFL